jgi:hypothetical protein
VPTGRSGAIDKGNLGNKPIAVKDSAAGEELIDLWRWERPLSLMSAAHEEAAANA